LAKYFNNILISCEYHINHVWRVVPRALYDVRVPWRHMFAHAPWRTCISHLMKSFNHTNKNKISASPHQAFLDVKSYGEDLLSILYSYTCIHYSITRRIAQFNIIRKYTGSFATTMHQCINNLSRLSKTSQNITEVEKFSAMYDRLIWE